ncbi:hypothetical protein [uncultured Jatrophihabitans sp.]|uniref:hypothetical protein n=1 Tax=uncultured Jatrophihabitans sp. TaxID=1610747 RepID=UPI0035CA5AE0
MVDAIDHWGAPFQVDAALRVVTSRGVGYIDGNVHTHRGRFGVWYPEMRDGLATSLDEVESMTDEASIWITGFLEGDSPDLYDYLGADVDETPEELARWQAFCARFVQTGVWPALNARPTQPVPISDAGRIHMKLEGWIPWSYVGERVWVQRADAWVEADPQPDVDAWGFLHDSTCQHQGWHENLDDLPAEWEICVDCGFVHFQPEVDHIALNEA